VLEDELFVDEDGVLDDDDEDEDEVVDGVDDVVGVVVAAGAGAMAVTWLNANSWPLTTSCGEPDEKSTPVTVPVVPCAPLVAEATLTWRPIKVLACNPWMLPVMVCDCCSALNCASCAANAVSLCGFSGSWDVICVTSNCKKSACERVWLPTGVVDEEATVDIRSCPRFPALPGNGFVFGFRVVGNGFDRRGNRRF